MCSSIFLVLILNTKNCYGKFPCVHSVYKSLTDNNFIEVDKKINLKMNSQVFGTNTSSFACVNLPS